MAFKRGYDRRDGESLQPPAFVPKNKDILSNDVLLTSHLNGLLKGFVRKGEYFDGNVLEG